MVVYEIGEKSELYRRIAPMTEKKRLLKEGGVYQTSA